MGKPLRAEIMLYGQSPPQVIAPGTVHYPSATDIAPHASGFPQGQEWSA